VTMTTLFSYILLGLSLAAPIGPINAAQLDKGIKKGFLHAWLVGVGAMIADALYMLMIYFGVVHFLDTSFMKTFLWLFGCFVLVYTGIESMIGAGKIREARNGKDETLFKSFASGFLMSLSSPLTILFWVGIYGSVLAETAASLNKQQLILYSAAIFLGILIWDITMAGLSSSFRKFLTPRALFFISLLSGVSLVGFGVHFGMEAFKALFG
jgi:L-lysine exporter family protein LysE/ArgO